MTRWSTYLFEARTLALWVDCTRDHVTVAGEKQYKFEEILPLYKAVSSEAEAGTFADFMEAFKTFDREGQGLIHAAELRHVLTSLGELFGDFIKASTIKKNDETAVLLHDSGCYVVVPLETRCQCRAMSYKLTNRAMNHHNIGSWQ